MTSILLINPNMSSRTTDMMVSIASPLLPPNAGIRGMSATQGVNMLVNEADLAIAAAEVVRMGKCEADNVDAIVVAAFGNPGASALREQVSIPVVGIGEAAIMEAAANGRRFGIATTTPDLVDSITAGVHRLSCEHCFTGVRVPDADPLALAADPDAQEAALAKATADCIHLDRAEAVVIGGGPLSETAIRLRRQFDVEIVEPIPAAIRHVLRLIGNGIHSAET